MLEPTAPAPTCRTRPRSGGPLGSGCCLWVTALGSSVCRQVFHRTSMGPPEARPHAARNTRPTPRATANNSTDVIGLVWHGEEGPLVETAAQPSAQAVTSSLDAGPGPMARDGRPARAGPHRMQRKGLAVPAASLMAVASGPSSVPVSFGRYTDNAGTHRASRFAAATAAGPAAGERSAAGRMISATSSTGHAPP